MNISHRTGRLSRRQAVPSRAFLCCSAARLRRGYLPRRLAGRPMGLNVNPPAPQVEQRNLPHASGNGVSAA
jgi:hypothetical protein